MAENNPAMNPTERSVGEIIGALNQSPSLNVRQLVGELVNHPQLQSLRPSVAPQRVSNNSSPATSVEDEIRRAFRGGRSDLPRPHIYQPTSGQSQSRYSHTTVTPRINAKKKSACSVKPKSKQATNAKNYTKTVILVNENMNRLATDKRDLHSNGRVASCVKLDTGMSAEEVSEMMKNVFEDKFDPRCTEPWFKYMKADRNRLFAPKTPVDTVWDGAMVKQLAGNGNIYIMATQPLNDEYVSIKFQDYFEISDCESDDNKAKKRKCVIPMQATTEKRRIGTTQTTSTDFFDKWMPDGDLLADGQDVTTSSHSNFENLNLQSVLAASLMEEKFSYEQYGRLGQKFEEWRTEYMIDGDVDLIMNDDMANPAVSVIVNRKRLWTTAVKVLSKPDFNFSSKIQVEFSGEDGLDGGGLTREFLRLLIKACMEQSGIFEGPASTLVFSRDYSLLEKGTYAFVGKLVAWSALLGGPGIYLAKEVYVMMNGMCVKKLPIDLVSDADYKDKIAMLCDCKDPEEYKKVKDRLFDWILDVGYSKINNVEYSERLDVANTLIAHFSFYRCKAMIEQFIDGLNAIHSFWDKVKDDPALFLPIFVGSMIPGLTRQLLKSQCAIQYSAEMSNDRAIEESAIYAWETFLKNVEDGKYKSQPTVNLSDVLKFMTGASEIPPLGFHKKISIRFFPVEPSECRLPYASTCDLALYLPRMEDEEKIHDCLEMSFRSGFQFGKS